MLNRVAIMSAVNAAAFAIVDQIDMERSKIGQGGEGCSVFEFAKPATSSPTDRSWLRPRFWLLGL